MIAKVTYNTGMSPLLSVMYLVLATVLSTGPTFAAHIPIMNDLFYEQNEVVEPVYSKYENTRYENNLEDKSIREQVRVDIKSPLRTRALSGERVEIVCEASGSPPPKIQWYKGLKPIQEGGFEEQNDLGSLALASVKSRLVIDCVTPHHQGLYTCQAISGSQSKISSPASVYVEGGDNKTCLAPRKTLSPPRILTWTPVTIATINGDISLPCAASGYPTPQIYWVTQDNAVVENDSRMKVLETGELFISKLHWNDMGDYSCVAYNSAGKTKESTFLYPLSEEE